MAVFCMVLIVSSSFSAYGYAWLDRLNENDEKNLGEIVLVNVDKYEPTVITSDYIRNKYSPVWIQLSGNTLEGYFFGQSEGKSLDTAFGDLKIKDFEIDRSSYSKYVKYVDPIPPQGGYKVDASGNLDLGAIKVYLNKIPNEEDIPDIIDLNFTAHFEFDYDSGFGIFGRQDLYFDNVKLTENGQRSVADIWNGKGSLELVSVEGSKANFILRESDGDEIDKFSLKVGNTKLTRLRDSPTFLGDKIRLQLKSLGGVEDVASILIFGEERDYIEKMNLYTGSDWIVENINYNSVTLFNEETKEKEKLVLRGAGEEEFRVIDCDNVAMEDKEVVEFFESGLQVGIDQKGSVSSSYVNPVSDPALQKSLPYTLDIAEDGLYCSAVNEYKTALDYVAAGNEQDEINYNVAVLYDKLKDPWNELEYLSQIRIDGDLYENNRIADAIAQAQIKLASSGLGCGNINGVSVCLRAVTRMSEESSVFLRYDFDRDGDNDVKEFKEGDIIVTSNNKDVENGIVYFLGKLIDKYNRGSAFEWRIEKIKPGSILVKTVGPGINEKEEIPLGELGSLVYERIHGEPDKSLAVEVVNINSPLNAVVSVLPGDGNNFATSHFSVHLPIEKSLIQWTPEQIDGMIEKTQATIKKLDSIIDNLGKFIKGMKVACYSVFGYISVKNAFFLKNKGRKDAFDKWHDFCQEKAGNDHNIKVSECLKENADKLEEDVILFTDAIEKSEDLIKRMNKGDESAYTEIARVLGRDQKFVDGYLKNEDAMAALGYGKEEIRGFLKKVYLGGNVSAELAKVDNLVSKLSVATSVEQRKSILESVMDEKVTRGPINRRGILGGGDEEVLDALEKKSLSTSDMKYVASTVVVGEVIKVYDINVGDAGGFVTVTPVVDENNKQYFLDNRVVFKDENNKIYLGDANINNINSNYAYGEEKKSYPEESTGRLIYFAFKGSKGTFPNAGKANYVQVKYDESKAEQRNYVVYNVGNNGKINFAGGDDIPLFQVNYDTSGIKASEVNYAKIYRDIEGEYQKRLKNYGKEYDKGKIPTSAEYGGITEANCGSYMSLSDCDLLFGVCDPVMCPASRFDLGGTWKVDDVVQTGIIGSLVLGLHNFGLREPLPICLTGVNAGLENIRSKFMGFEDCLGAARDSGDSIGICNTIRSVYMCEILWREGLSIFGSLGGISDIISNKVLKRSESLTEYLNWGNSWDKLGDSVNYFTTVYARGAFAAYKARNLGEFGTEVCKSAIYGKNPGIGSFVGELLEPSSPYQFTGFFDENVQTTLEGGKSSYRIYYHIYAGNNERVNYIVYLKGPGKADLPVTKSEGIVQTRTLGAGDYVDESFTTTDVDSGYTQMCIRINNDESCGFGRVSSSFSVKYLNDKAVENELNQEISSDEECSLGNYVPGSSIVPSGLSTTGLLKTCSRYDPDGNEDRWVKVGECSSEGVSCYLDYESVDFEGYTDKSVEYKKKYLDEYGDGEIPEEEAEYAAILGIRLGELNAHIEKLKEGGNIREGYKYIDDYRGLIGDAEGVIPILVDAHVSLGDLFVLLAESFEVKVSGGTDGDTPVDGIPNYLRIQVDVRGGVTDPVHVWENGHWDISASEGDAEKGLSFDEGLKLIYDDVQGYTGRWLDKFKQLKITCNTQDEKYISKSLFEVLEYEAFKEKTLSFCGSNLGQDETDEERLKLPSSLSGAFIPENYIKITLVPKGWEKRNPSYEWENNKWIDLSGVNSDLSYDFDDGFEIIKWKVLDEVYPEIKIKIMDKDKEETLVERTLTFQQFVDFCEKLGFVVEKSVKEIPVYLKIQADIRGGILDQKAIWDYGQWDINFLGDEEQKGLTFNGGLREVYDVIKAYEGNWLEKFNQIKVRCNEEDEQYISKGDFSVMNYGTFKLNVLGFCGNSFDFDEVSPSCEGYSSEVNLHAEWHGVDPSLIMAVMMRESSCNSNVPPSGADAYGLMQITNSGYSGTFDTYCKNKIDGIQEFEDVQGASNYENNIQCGVKILKDKYSEYKDGVYESWSYKNNEDFKELIDDCVVTYPKYADYTGWGAALRGYNGWGCNPVSSDIDYVEKVNKIYAALNSNQEEQVACSEISELGSCYNYEYCFVKEKEWWNFLGDDECTSCYDASCEDIGAMAKCDGSCGAILDCEWSNSECSIS